MPRRVPVLALCAAVALLAGGTAAAQQPAPTTPAPPTAPAPSGPPALESLRLPRVISAQQGHARFLVGVRLSAPAKLTVQVLKASDGRVVQSTTETSARRAGRAYLRVEAVDERGFQLLQGNYKVRLQATDAEGRVSDPLEGAFRLRLTPPRGLFDAYTVPLWRAFRRQAGGGAPGQLVAVVAPRGAAAAAGLRRGDVITAIDGAAVASPGAFSAALRALPADREVPVTLARRGREITATLKPAPDWEAAPDHAAALTVATRREPRTLAYAVARVRHLVESGKRAEAARLWAAWPRSWRLSAPGNLVQGDLLAAQRRWKPALGAYSRARAKDAGMAAAEFGRGIALSELGRTAGSRRAFTAAARLDPGDPAAAGFLAYALLREDRVEEALAAAHRAVALDPRYADGFLPLGVALLASGDRPNGLKALRRGLILLEEPERAARLMRAHLERADP